MIDKFLVRVKYGSWNDWREENPEASVILDGVKLDGMVLTGLNLSGASLRGASLHATNLMNADLRNADLTAANLAEADLIGANLEGAILLGSNLREADLLGANLTNARFSPADLLGALHAPHAFAPSFRHFHQDIEDYLTSEGKREKNQHGQIVFRGYPAALEQMFRRYVEKQAFAPLVAELRKWNWEWSYSAYLLELTAGLQQAGDWPRLKELWAAVVAKRRTNYNKTKKARKSVPDKVPEELVVRTRELLLESLYRIQRYAAELGHESDVGPYSEMIVRVEKRLNA